jgi:hypothetical protein
MPAPTPNLKSSTSPMIFTIHSNKSYLSESQARSRAGGIFYLRSKHDPAHPAPTNGAVHITSIIIKHVMSSKAEDELGALFYIAQDACSIRVTLEDLGHPQPFKPTTNALKVNPTIPSRNADPKQWKCSSTGSDTGLTKASSSSTGSPEKPISQITSPSIIHRPIIKPCVTHTYRAIQLSYELVRVCYKCTPRTLTLFSVLEDIFLPKSLRLHENALNHSQ